MPDLHARVTLLDKDNKVITHLGYDQAWTKHVLDGGKLSMRGKPDRVAEPAASSIRTTPASTRTATSSSSNGCRPAACRSAKGFVSSISSRCRRVVARGLLGRNLRSAMVRVVVGRMRRRVAGLQSQSAMIWAC